MDFTTPTPEPRLWRQMSDAERLTYFALCASRQPVDFSLFREALKARRKTPRT